MDTKREKTWVIINTIVSCVVAFVFLLGFIVLLNLSAEMRRKAKLGPVIELVSMDFTVFNITQTHITSKWDLSIRIPHLFAGPYICIQGDFQSTFLYKNITLATSSPQEYRNLQYGWRNLLKISAVVSEESIGGLIGKNMMEDVKDKREIRFGSQLFLTDCRENMEPVMSFACDEATLRFESGSEMKARLFGNHPTCINY